MVYRILLTEDSPIIQKVVEDILRQEGFEVKTVTDGDEIFREFDSFNPHIILVSTDLHNSDGYEICNKIRVVSKDIPIILLAGAYEPFDEERASMVEATEHIIKPFEACDLVSKIKKLLKIEGFESYEPPFYQDELVQNLADTKSNIEPQLVDHVTIRSESLNFNDTTDTLLSIESKIMEPQISIVPPINPPNTKSTELSISNVDKEIANLLRQPLEDILDYYLKTKLTEEISSSLREKAIEVIYELAPKIIDEILKQKMAILITLLASEIESEIKKALPEIIEKIIKKRLEKVD